MKKEHIGYCHICQKYGKLSFEHIPPKLALNNRRTKAYTGDSMIELISGKNRYPWDKEGLRYESLQKGFGVYTLCCSCNSLTGTLYAEEYAKWFYSVLEMIRKNQKEYNDSFGAQFTLAKVYPGRFIKQILSIACSSYPNFVNDYPFVKDLILKKNFVFKENPGFKIYMYLLKTPLNGYTSKAGYLLKDVGLKFVNEIFLYPFGFIISLSDFEEREMDITSFIQYGYDDEAIIDFKANIHEKNSLFPIDYRSQDEIKKTANSNNEK